MYRRAIIVKVAVGALVEWWWRPDGDDDEQLRGPFDEYLAAVIAASKNGYDVAE